MVGITAYGSYIPKKRLNRMAIIQSMGWLAPGLMTAARGERSMCNWDEDAMTMAVAAAKDCVTGMDKSAINAAYLASTSLPFKDRQNSGILATALNLPEEGLVTADFTSSLRSGTTALLTAIDAVQGEGKSNVLVAASDARDAKSAWFYEMWYGDGAACLLVGKDKVIAEFKGAYSVACDFVNTFKGANAKFDYGWEERWIREEGFAKIIPAAINGLLEKCGVSIIDVAKVVYPCYLSSNVHKGVAKPLKAAPEQIQDNLADVVGDTGAAQPLAMFVAALEEAKPGDKIVVASFGQGCDALLFEVTENIKNLPARKGMKGSLANRQEETQYSKLQTFREVVNVEMGIRAESNKQTALSALWRHRKQVLGLVGGKCTKCGTPQYPRMRMCVNPDCSAVDSQVDHEFADRTGIIKSYTGDMLAVSVDPPAIYGLVQFEGGGRALCDFTDCALADVKVGQQVKMSFRIKYYDNVRDFHGYYWKAVPQI
ncbi:MAG: OB-fold domain-containing protein [bacterium]